MMRRRRKRGRWFPAAAVFLLAGCVWSGGSGLGQSGKKDFPAVAWIREQEQADTGAIEEKINARDEAERQAAQEAAEAAAQAEQNAENALSEQTGGGAGENSGDPGSLKSRFGQAVIVGDSVAEGFIDYEILDPVSIVAHKGLRADSAGAEIEKALDLSPTVLFLSFGLNDLEYCQGDSSRFVKEYEKRLQEIRDRAPDLPICVNAIMPVLPAAVEKKPVLAHVAEFNAALKALCEKWGVTFLDSGDLLAGHEDWYQKDSIHLTSQPYSLWLERMEEAAGL